MPKSQSAEGHVIGAGVGRDVYMPSDVGRPRRGSCLVTSDPGAGLSSSVLVGSYLIHHEVIG